MCHAQIAEDENTVSTATAFEDEEEQTTKTPKNNKGAKKASKKR